MALALTGRRGRPAARPCRDCGEPLTGAGARCAWCEAEEQQLRMADAHARLAIANWLFESED